MEPTPRRIEFITVDDIIKLLKEKPENIRGEQREILESFVYRANAKINTTLYRYTDDPIQPHEDSYDFARQAALNYGMFMKRAHDGDEKRAMMYMDMYKDDRKELIEVMKANRESRTQRILLSGKGKPDNKVLPPYSQYYGFYADGDDPF